MENKRDYRLYSSGYLSGVSDAIQMVLHCDDWCSSVDTLAEMLAEADNRITQKLLNFDLEENINN